MNSEPEPDGVMNKFGGDCTDRRLIVQVDSLIAGEHHLVETIIGHWSAVTTNRRFEAPVRLLLVASESISGKFIIWSSECN